MGRRCVAPYPTRPTRPLEHSRCRAKPTRTVRVHCDHILMWSECTRRTRRSGRSVYTGNTTRTVRERYARRVKLSVCTRPMFVHLTLHLPGELWIESVSASHTTSSGRKARTRQCLVDRQIHPICLPSPSPC